MGTKNIVLHKQQSKKTVMNVPRKTWACRYTKKINAIYRESYAGTIDIRIGIIPSGTMHPKIVRQNNQTV